MEISEKLRLVEECRSSGITAKEWCQSKGITYRRYMSWASLANKTQEPDPEEHQSWVALEIPKATVNGARADAISLELGKCRIVINAGFDPSTLESIIQVVQTVC